MSTTIRTVSKLEISGKSFSEIKKKLKAANYKHVFIDDNTIDMHGIALVPVVKKQSIKGELMNGAELRFAARNKLAVYYVEMYDNPSDKHMNFRGKCFMTKISGDSYYIGNSDIDVSEYKDTEFVNGDFPEGDYAVYKINGIKYK